MKKLLTLVVASVLLASCGMLNLNTERLLQSGVYAAQALSITDAQVQEYIHEYITQLDAQSTILPESNSYTKRLRKLTQGILGVNEVPLNFQVYKENEVNAFACADGSVRVYTGIMDVMTDNELLGIIGHEIGHVAMNHTRRQMQSAILASAAREGIASIGDTAAALSDSMLGDIGEAILSAQYSQRQESQADDYGYEFLVACGRNPWAMVQSFEKLQQLAGETESNSMVNNIFSTHPSTTKRIEAISSRCLQDGYNRPK